jgi:putative phage-type endonuclease
VKDNLKLYTKLDLIQGSKEWLAARLEHVTASNVPCLFNLSPYKTKLQYFEELTTKTEKPISDQTQVLFDIGHKAEAMGREYVEKHYGFECPASVVVSQRCPGLLASLDGFNETRKIIFEAKYVGAETLRKIKEEGTLPVHHEYQVQAQLLATGAEKCVYFALDPQGHAAVIELTPNADIQVEIIEAVQEFLSDLKEGKAPAPSMRDYIEIKDAKFEELERLKVQLDLTQKLFDEVKQELAEKYKDHTRIRSGLVTMVRSFRKGNIAYAKVPQLKGVDLEKYRGAAIESVTVRLEKEGKK